MGIYDRDYYRQGGSGFRLTVPRTAVVAIILVNAAVFVAEIVSQPGGQTKVTPQSRIAWLLSDHVEVARVENGVRIPPQDDTLTRPWMWWQFLTCGFVHDPNSWSHILFNMMTLFFLGPTVEEWYGTREFVRLYLVSLVFSSVFWAVTVRLFDPNQPSVCFGASGAVTAVVVLFALLFPKRTLQFMLVLPLPAWLVGALLIGIDIFGAMGKGDRHVAYAAHLGGAAFALAYFQLHWNLGSAGHAVAKWVKGHSRPPLKVFKPDEDADAPVAEEEVDRILTKIHSQGEGSLTAKERRIMEHASREYRRRLRPH